MSVIAIAAMRPPVEDAVPVIPVAEYSRGGDGFAADGRCALAGGHRSAWTCPSFYLAIPACGVLLIAVLMVRLACRVWRMFR